MKLAVGLTPNQNVLGTEHKEQNANKENNKGEIFVQSV